MNMNLHQHMTCRFAAGKNAPSRGVIRLDVLLLETRFWLAEILHEPKRNI